MKLKDLFADLQTMFNVWWKIDGSDLILEHISYFAVGGRNYTTRQCRWCGNTTPKYRKRKIRVVGHRMQYHIRGRPDHLRLRQWRRRAQSVAVLHRCSIHPATKANQDKISDENFVLVSNKTRRVGLLDKRIKRKSGLAKPARQTVPALPPFLTGTMNGEGLHFFHSKIQNSLRSPSVMLRRHIDPTKYIYNTTWKR